MIGNVEMLLREVLEDEDTYGFGEVMVGGVRTKVYIPVSVMNAVRDRVFEDDMVTANLCVNNHERSDKVPFYAVRIDVGEDVE